MHIITSHTIFSNNFSTIDIGSKRWKKPLSTYQKHRTRFPSQIRWQVYQRRAWQPQCRRNCQRKREWPICFSPTAVPIETILRGQMGMSRPKVYYLHQLFRQESAFYLIYCAMKDNVENSENSRFPYKHEMWTIIRVLNGHFM